MFIARVQAQLMLLACANSTRVSGLYKSVWVKRQNPDESGLCYALKPVKLNTGVRDDVVRVELFLHDALLQLRLYACVQQ